MDTQSSSARQDRPPIRIVTRLLGELQAAIVSDGLRVIDGDLDRFAIFTLIVRQSLTRPKPETRATGISAYSLASSLSRPYETVRRHVNALVAAGLCERISGGFTITAQGLDHSGVAGVMERSHDSLVRFIADLRALGVPMPQQRRTAAHTPSAVVQAAVDVMLAVVDTNQSTHADWLDLVVYSTILCGNVRDFARDPVLARAYADERNRMPPELCQPVRASVAARVIGISETSVRRRAAAMIADGRIEKRRHGFVISEQWLNRPTSIAASTASYQNIRRILERLAADGFPFSEPETAYLRGRPADVVFR